MKLRNSNSKQPAWKLAVLLLVPMIVLLIADWLISPHYRLAFNETESLPGTLFLVKVGRLPSCGTDTGEHVQFQMAEDRRWYKGVRMLKVAKGCPGDVISIEDRQVYINDWLAGEAVPTLEDGTPMQVIQAGTIPEDYYYMWASHPSSFDSRYAEYGVIPSERFIGVATRIF